PTAHDGVAVAGISQPRRFFRFGKIRGREKNLLYAIPIKARHVLLPQSEAGNRTRTGPSLGASICALFYMISDCRRVTIRLTRRESAGVIFRQHSALLPSRHRLRIL